MIRKLTQEEYNNAADLSYQVCMERNDFTQEGIETFKSFVYDTSLMNTLDIYGAFDNHLLIGIIGVHRERQHISLFFVLPHYHRKHPIKYTIKKGCISFQVKQPSMVVSPSFFIPFFPFVWQHL